MSNSEEYQRDLNRYLDGEMSPEETEEFRRRIADDPERSAEVESLETLKDVTNQMPYHEPPERIWEGYWQGVYRRLERGVGWIIMSAGLVLLTIYGLYYFLQNFLLDGSIPILLRIGVALAAAGAIILLVSIARERFFSYRNERYEREVEL